jgi:hypothetical protein
MASVPEPIPAGLITQISSVDGSVNITAPSGNRIDLSAPGTGANIVTGVV